MQHPTAPLEHPMPDPRDRWRYSQQQWDQLVAAEQSHRAPAGPVAGVPVETWDRMTAAEQAKLYADQANAQAVVQSQQRASQSTKNTLIVIFVLIPVVLLLLYLAVQLIGQMG